MSDIENCAPPNKRTRQLWADFVAKVVGDSAEQ